MCGCEAHHTAGAVCTCICPPSSHASPSDVALQNAIRGQAVPDEEPLPLIARLLRLDRHGDDPDLYVRYLYGNQVNQDAGYVADEVVLTLSKNSWALGVEFEHSDLSGYKKASWWRGLSLRIGPFTLTASRQQAEEF